MSKINSWHPSERTVYLRHPDSGRVLELNVAVSTVEFLRALQEVGYTPATREDYRAQEEARLVKQRGGAA